MLEGEISQINLVERLVELWREQFTGAIRFENDGIIKIVYFKGGDILSASTNDRSDSIDEILMRAGKVSREHVKQALAKRKETETLGDALLNLGFIVRKELTWARRVQVVGVIRSIAAWTVGSFTIVADYLPKRDEGTLFPLPQVLVELIVTEQDRARFEGALDGGNAVFAKAGDFDEVWRRLGLNEDAEAISAEIDGEKSAADVATASGRDTFNVYKLLDALATLRILTRVDKPQVEHHLSLDDFASAGLADAADQFSEPPPVVHAPPQFELDEEEAARQPTLSVPIMSFDAPVAAPPPVSVASSSSWADEEAVPVRPSSPAPLPIPTTLGSAAAASEEQWGFDEAQIETSRKATIPPQSTSSTGTKSFRKAQKAKPSRYGLLVALMVVFILAAGGYFGFQWWQGRQAPEAVAVHRPAPPRPAATQTAPPASSATTPEIVAGGASTTAPPAGVPETSPAVTSQTPPATATVAAATETVEQALPKVIAATRPPASGDQARYDAMAREFAANPTGNFTVQIQILCDPGNLGAAMRDGGSEVWFVPQAIGARSCYRVFWGHFATRDEAQRALGRVPAGIRDRSAAVKAVPR